MHYYRTNFDEFVAFDHQTWCKLALDSPSRTQVDPQLESEISETIFEVLDAIERDYLKDGSSYFLSSFLLTERALI
jgi:hypothetical protein